jgi:hypothetical protein
MAVKSTDLLHISSFTKRHRFDGLTLLLAGVLFAPVFFLAIYYKTANDYHAHLGWAMMLDGDPTKIPGFILAHTLWESLVFSVHRITFAPYEVAALLVTLGSALWAAWVIYHEVRAIIERAAWPKWWAVGLSLAVLVANPISLLALRDHQYYLSYVAMNSYHNPTILLLKPIALLQFAYTFRGFIQPVVSGKAIALLAFLSLLSTYAKPSFTVCLLPAIGLMVVLRWFTKGPIPWKLIIWGVGMPSAAVLAAQYVVSYVGSQDGGIIFAPLAVMRGYSSHLFPKFVLSIFFSVLVTVYYWRDALRSPSMILAWGCFFAGALSTYLLAESGTRFYYGNFTWSGEIANFVLFFCTTLFFLERLAQPGALKGGAQKLLGGVWSLHIVAGVVYLLVCTLTNNYY